MNRSIIERWNLKTTQIHKQILTYAQELCRNTFMLAPVVKLVDAADSKSAARKGVLVQVRPGAPNYKMVYLNIYRV